MSKGIIVRLDEGLHSELDTKLRDKGISKQFFFSKCVELFINGELAIDSSQVSNDSSNEVMELKKTIAIILERLDKLENDTKMIAFDTTITNTGLENNDSSQVSNDSNKILNDSNEVSNDSSIDSEPMPISDKPKLALESVNDVKVPKQENEGKKTAYDKVLEFINFKYKGEKIVNKLDLANKCNVDNSFFSQKKGKGKAMWEQYVIPVTVKQGDKEVITHYIIKK